MAVKTRLGVKRAKKKDLTQIFLPPHSTFSCLRCAAWSSLRICSYKYFNLQVNFFFGGGDICRHVWRHFESETSHTAPKQFRYVFHLAGHQFIVKMSTGPSLAFQWLVPGKWSPGRERKKRENLRTMQCGSNWLRTVHEKWEINSCGGSCIPPRLTLPDLSII